MLRFDSYSVILVGNDYHVAQIGKNLNLMAAQILAGIEETDFIESVTQTGWVGSCPQWTEYMPIVTIPHKGRLALDQLGFMMESMSE